MQSLGFSPSVYVWERDWFGQQDHFIIFIFRKFKPQNILIFKGHLYQRQIAVFQSTATFSSFCPLRKGMHAWLRMKADGKGGGETGNWKCCPWASVTTVWVCSPGLMLQVGWRAAECQGTWACSLSPVPSPSPWELPKWAGPAVFKGGLAESILLVFQSGSFQKGIIMIGFINLLVNQFFY